jgi:hypothetical protein
MIGSHITRVMGYIIGWIGGGGGSHTKLEGNVMEIIIERI